MPNLNHPSRNEFSAHILLEIEQEERQREALCAYARRERAAEITGAKLFKFFLLVCAAVCIGLLVAHNIWPESF